MFQHILEIFSGEGREQARQTEIVVNAAIEQTIDGTDPRLRSLPGHQRKLREAVGQAVTYAGDLIERLPPPIEVTPAGLTTDSLLRAYFSSVNHIHEVFALSRTFREFLGHRNNVRLPECYALLATEMSEKTVFGYALEGEAVRGDIKQTAVNFSQHRIITPSSSEAETRQKLKERAFNNLIASALSRIASLRTRRDELVKQKSLLQEKLGTLQSSCKFGLQGEFGLADLANDDPECSSNRLQEIEDELSALAANPLTLEDYLDEIRDVMEHPADHLKLSGVPLSLDRMNIKLDPGDAGEGAQLMFHEVTLPNSVRRVVSLLKIPQEQMASIVERFSSRPKLTDVTI